MHWSSWSCWLCIISRHTGPFVKSEYLSAKVSTLKMRLRRISPSALISNRATSEIVVEWHPLSVASSCGSSLQSKEERSWWDDEGQRKISIISRTRPPVWLPSSAPYAEVEICCGARVHLEGTCWVEAPSSKDTSVWMSLWTVYEPYHSEKDEPTLYNPLDALDHKECVGPLLCVWLPRYHNVH